MARKTRSAKIWARVTPDMKRWIDVQAQKASMSRSSWIEFCLKRVRDEMRQAGSEKPED